LFFNVILKWHFAFFAIGTKFFYANEKRRLVHAETVAANEYSSYSSNRADAFIFQNHCSKRTVLRQRKAV